MTSRTHIMIALLLVFVITASSIFWLYISDQTSREMQTKEAHSKQSMSLTVIGPWAGSELDSFMPVLTEFEKSTVIDVNYKVYRADELATLLPAQFAAEKAPGDVIFMWVWFIKEQAKDGHILEVTDLINKSDFLDGSLDVVEARA